jgi:hypothetical protein
MANLCVNEDLNGSALLTCDGFYSTQPQPDQCKCEGEGNALPQHKDKVCNCGNDKCLVLNCLDELTKHIAQLQDAGYLDGGHQEMELPPFMICWAKLKLPQMDTLISKEDIEFINYFSHLHQCNVLEVANTDWAWMRMLMENFASGGHLKRVISKQASILELPQGNVGAMTNTWILKSIKKQMSYNHNFKTKEIMRIQALTIAVRVEVDPGFK